MNAQQRTGEQQVVTQNVSGKAGISAEIGTEEVNCLLTSPLLLKWFQPPFLLPIP